MAESDIDESRTLDRRTLLAAGAGATIAAGLAGALARPESAGAQSSDPGQSRPSSQGNLVLETVTGPLRGNEVDWALEHEHLFVDFDGAKDPSYQDVDWADVTGACVNSVNELRAQGINLFVEYTPMGVGRNVLLARDVARQTGMHIVSASGIYRSSFGIPPQYAGMSADELAGVFVRELTLGVDGSRIRAGFIKIAVDDDGPKPPDEPVWRGAARAAVTTGCTIGLHAPVTAQMKTVVAILESEGFNVANRFIWAHAEYGGTIEDYKELAGRGGFVSLDAVTVGGVPGDDAVLELIGQMNDAGFLGNLLLSTDSTIFVKPPASQYGFQNTYLFRVFKPKLEERFGKHVTQQLLRDNVVFAYRRGDNVS
jgi:phosphotriesterase-related protein